MTLISNISINVLINQSTTKSIVIFCRIYDRHPFSRSLCSRKESSNLFPNVTFDFLNKLGLALLQLGHILEFVYSPSQDIRSWDTEESNNIALPELEPVAFRLLACWLSSKPRGMDKSINISTNHSINQTDEYRIKGTTNQTHNQSIKQSLNK